MKKDKIILIGGGGHCKSVIDIIEQENRFEIVGIIDKKELLNSDLLGYKVIGCDDDLVLLYKKYKYAFITVGHIKSNTTRVKLFNTVKSIGYTIPTIISPFAYISQYAKIGEGTLIAHHSFINADVTIGKNCIINTKAIIEHDTTIEDNCHISTGAIINGGVKVKENSFLGSGSVTKEYIEISGFNKAGELLK